MDRRDLTVDALLTPHNEHIVVIPVAIEKLLSSASSGCPRRGPNTSRLALSSLSSAVLLFVYVRRRVGPWLGPLRRGAAALPRPRLGGAAVAVRDQLRRLGALRPRDAARARPRRPQRRYRGLRVSGPVLRLLQPRASPSPSRPPSTSSRNDAARGLGRAYVVAVPVVLYAAWYLGWGHDAETHVSLRNVLASPRFVFESMAVAVGSVFGLGTTPFGGSTDPVWGRAILVALVVVFAYRQVRKPGFSPVSGPSPRRPPPTGS